MSVEDTHLWKDYYDGSEEEGWQDADPFDKDQQDSWDFYDENIDNDDLPIDMYTVPPDVQNTPKVADHVPQSAVTQSHGAMYYILLAIGFFAIIAIIGRLV